MSEPKSAYERVKEQHEYIIEINGANHPPLTYGQAFDDIAELLADYEALRGMEARLKRARYMLNKRLNEESKPEDLRERYMVYDIWRYERDMVNHILDASYDVPKPEDYEN